MVTRGRRIGVALREAQAMLTQARYLGRDWKVIQREGKGPHVVFLHGLYASAGVWTPLRSHLQERLDVGSASLSYIPGPGIEELSERLRLLIASIHSAKAIHLVGHSLGGLVIRHYVRQYFCDERVVQSVSLASPFLGSLKNHLVPGQAGLDLRAEAEILEPLRRRDAPNLRVPHLALLAQDDQMIIPGAFPDYGKHRVIPQAGHNGILFAEETRHQVEQFIADFRP